MALSLCLNLFFMVYTSRCTQIDPSLHCLLGDWNIPMDCMLLELPFHRRPRHHLHPFSLFTITTWEPFFSFVHFVVITKPNPH